MPRRCYVPKEFNAEHAAIIQAANGIIRTYLAAGYKLTLRQLYYQFVARGLLENTQRNYKRLGSIINDARLAGLVDWEAIEDRTRNLESVSHWDTPGDIIASAAHSYRLDKWERQPFYVEVWIEKEALAGVFERVCTAQDVPYFSCRGYTSQSEMWAAAQRLIQRGEDPGREGVVILHFGDHDPSGIDMTRDIQDRLALFGSDVDVRRLALNMDQVDEYSPPPNPAKLTDSRCAGYMDRYGDESWELDALEPAVLANLVEEQLDDLRDGTLWAEDLLREEEERAALRVASQRWDDVVEFLEEDDDADGE